MFHLPSLINLLIKKSEKNIHKKAKKKPMGENFTLLFWSQHYPVSQLFQVFSFDEMSIEADIADFLQSSEQKASQPVLDRINAYAAACL